VPGIAADFIVRQLHKTFGTQSVERRTRKSSPLAMKVSSRAGLEKRPF